MLNCPHLRTSKDFWSGWIIFESTAETWIESTQCCTQLNTYLVSDGELLVHMFFRDRITFRFNPFGIGSKLVWIYENYLMMNMVFASIRFEFLAAPLSEPHTLPESLTGTFQQCWDSWLVDPTSHEQNEHQSTQHGHFVVVQASDLKQHDHNSDKVNIWCPIQNESSHDFNNIQTRNVVTSHFKNIMCLKVL